MSGPKRKPAPNRPPSADGSDGYPRDLERVLPASALALFEETRRWFGHRVRPLNPPDQEDTR
jgi:hypothetical protein